MAKVPKKVKELLEIIHPLLTRMAKEEILRANELRQTSDELKKEVEKMQTEDE